MGRNLEEFIKKNYKKAIDNREIQPFYQPVIRVFSRQLCSFEALARWIDPEIGMIYPDEFIPVLEKEQAIHLLDTAILRQVCIRLRSSITNGEIPIPVSVNLSRLDFTLCDIFAVADQIVSEYHIPHEFIYFEITESVMAEEPEMLKEIVDRFRGAGYQIWMDDFGSAYSSLNALKELFFDEINLDMRFGGHSIRFIPRNVNVVGRENGRAKIRLFQSDAAGSREELAALLGLSEEADADMYFRIYQEYMLACGAVQISL